MRRGDALPGAVGPTLFRDDFNAAPNLFSASWAVEQESKNDQSVVKAENGRLTIDVSGGCTVWFRHELSGPVRIEYEATLIARGGKNDRVSDLNCFWMARNRNGNSVLTGKRRGGAFAEYDTLCAYYVGLGGNANTTTRFRRYIGKAGVRPLLPEHDLQAPEFLLKPNVRQKIRLIACDNLIQFWRDDRRLFEIWDDAPYKRGWFGFRTVSSHVQIENFHVYRLIPNVGTKP